MCLSPVYVRNPCLHKRNYASEFGMPVLLDKCLSPSSEFIEVPCGKCADCRSVYYNSVLQRALVESMTSYMYFVTLTYDDKHIPSITLPNGQVIFYSKYSDVQLMFKRFRDFFPRQFRYLVVNEYGDTYCRPHFHILLFVAKHQGDTLTTPHFLREIIFTNLGRYFAINIGSRKNPVYEPLYTFQQRYTSKGIRTNYFVQYVEHQDEYMHQHSDVMDIHYIRTIRYLLGYVNKGSRFDATIEHYLDEYAHDTNMCDSLKSLLSSKVRFSKGFGCGFLNGSKFYLPRISVRASSNSIYYTQFVENLPSSLDEFKRDYPSMYAGLQEHILKDRYSLYTSLSSCMLNFDHDDYVNHCLLLKYYPGYFTEIYKKYFRKPIFSMPTISSFYKYLHDDYSYQFTKVKTVEAERSPLFYYLRQMVEEGFANRCPFISFNMGGTYIAMSKYYKQRVCVVQDYYRLYNMLGVDSYEKYIALFSTQKNLKKAQRANSNQFSHFSEDNILQIQKKSLYLYRNSQGEDFYRSIFSNKLN